MTEQMVLKAEGVGELIGAVTALVGYMPAQSLVITPFVGTRAEGAMRVDLPANAEVYPALVAQVMGLTCRVQGVTGFAAIIYTDGTESEHEGLAATLLSAASFVGLDIATVAFLTPTSWGEYFEGEARPLDTLPALPGPGLVRDGDQTSSASLPVIDDALRVRILNAPLPHPESVDACALFEEALSWDVDALDAEKMAVLMGLLSLPLYRDVALTQWATTIEQGRETLAEQRAFVDGTPVSDRIGGVLIGKGPRPEVARLQAALAVCRVGAAHAPVEECSAALPAIKDALRTRNLNLSASAEGALVSASTSHVLEDQSDASSEQQGRQGSRVSYLASRRAKCPTETGRGDRHLRHL